MVHKLIRKNKRNTYDESVIEKKAVPEMSIGFVLLHEVNDLVELHDADETSMRENELALEAGADAVDDLALELHHGRCVVASGYELLLLDAFIDRAHVVFVQIAPTVDAFGHPGELLEFHAVAHFYVRVV